MRYIKSCGFVAFRQVDGVNYYLIIKSLNGDVGFPKGHMEGSESEIQTAIRELKEETGQTVEIIPDFRRQIEYPLPRVADTVKQTVYFLGRCLSDELYPQASEVKDARFLSYEEAMLALTFEDTKRILCDAEEFLRSK